MFSFMQKINFITHFLLKILQRNSKRVILGNLGISGHVYQQVKNLFHHPCFFWRYSKDMQTSYFGYYGHACLGTLKMIASTCKALRCLSACEK